MAWAPNPQPTSAQERRNAQPGRTRAPPAAGCRLSEGGRIPARSPSPARPAPTRLPARPRRRPVRTADEGVSAVVPDEGRRSPARQCRCSDLGTPARPYEAGSEAGDGFDPAFTRRPAASRSVTPRRGRRKRRNQRPADPPRRSLRRRCPCAHDADEELATAYPTGSPSRPDAVHQLTCWGRRSQAACPGATDERPPALGPRCRVRERAGPSRARASGAAIERACRERGWTLACVIRENGSPNGNGRKRPGLAHAAKQIRAGLAARIVVASLDHLGHSEDELRAQLVSATAEDIELVALDANGNGTPKGRRPKQAVR